MIDPICGMEVEPATAAVIATLVLLGPRDDRVNGKKVHEGETFACYGVSPAKKDQPTHW
jgi:hypothetical protein